MYLHPAMPAETAQNFASLCHELKVGRVRLDPDTFFDLLDLAAEQSWRVEMSGAGGERTTVFKVLGVEFRRADKTFKK